MSARPEYLRADEAAELGELLEFVERWLAGAPVAVASSFASFVAAPGYDLAGLRCDLRRFAFLLGAETFMEELP